MPAKHTPTPWHVQPIGGQRYIEAQGPKFICDMQADQCENPAEVEEMQANAEFIVRACNCHEELVQVLESVVRILEHNCPDAALPAIALAKTQIAKAKGQP